MGAQSNSETERISAAWDWILTALVILAIARWSWLTWPDPTIDFGREVYVPWRLSEGAVLYRDIAYHNGPLSPCLNAILFRVFGAGLHVLFAFNGLFLLGMLCLIRRWSAHIAGRLSAFAAALVFALLFAFERFLPYGNYNWMAPYSHEMTHGILLATGCLYLLVFRPHNRNVRFLLAGALAGLVFLTKAELFAALAAAAAVLLLLRARTALRSIKGIAALGLFGAGFLSPLLAFFLYFARTLQPPHALKAVTGAWTYVFAGPGIGSAFFQSYMGTDSPWISAAHVAGAFIGVVAALVLLGAVAWKIFRNADRADTFPLVCFFLVSCCAVLLARRTMQLDRAFLGLPAWTFAILCAHAIRLRKASDAQERSRLAAALVFSAFSLFLLLKMILGARIIHYGFGLALPATILTTCFLMHDVPAMLSVRNRAAAHAFRAGAAGLLAGVAAWFLLIMNANLNEQGFLVGAGRDTFRADARGAALQDTAIRLSAMLTPADTLVVIPESEMLNYLLRTRNPTPYGNFNPHQLEIFGEDRILFALAASPPTYVVWMDRIYDEYGADYFGRDYGKAMARWLTDNYKLVLATAPGSKLLQARMPVLIYKHRQFMGKNPL